MESKPQLPKAIADVLNALPSGVAQQLEAAIRKYGAAQWKAGMKACLELEGPPP